MSTIQKPESNDIFNKINDQTIKYPDVNTILNKLKSNNKNYFASVYDQLFDIFQSEHEFQMQEIVKIAQEQQNQNENTEDQFDFLDTYNLNSEIFKQSMMVIFGQLIDEIYKYFNQGVTHAVRELQQIQDQNQPQNRNIHSSEYNSPQNQRSQNASPVRPGQFHASLGQMSQKFDPNLQQFYKEMPQHMLYSPKQAGVRDEKTLSKTLLYLKQYSGLDELEQNKVIQEYLKYSNLDGLQDEIQQQQEQQYQEYNNLQQFQQQQQNELIEDEVNQENNQENEIQAQQVKGHQNTEQNEDQQTPQLRDDSQSQIKQSLQQQNGNIHQSSAQQISSSQKKIGVSAGSHYDSKQSQNRSSMKKSKQNNNNSQFNKSGSTYGERQLAAAKNLPQSFKSSGGLFGKAGRGLEDGRVKNPGVGMYDIGGDLRKQGGKNVKQTFGKSEKQSIFVEGSSKNQGPNTTYDPNIRYLSSNVSFNRSK